MTEPVGRSNIEWALANNCQSDIVGLITVCIPDLYLDPAFCEHLLQELNPHELASIPNSDRLWGELLAARPGDVRAMSGALSAALVHNDAAMAADLLTAMSATAAGRTAACQSIGWQAKFLIGARRVATLKSYLPLFQQLASLPAEHPWSIVLGAYARACLGTPAEGRAYLRTHPIEASLLKVMSEALLHTVEGRWCDYVEVWAGYLAEESSHAKLATDWLLAGLPYAGWPANGVAQGFSDLRRIVPNPIVRQAVIRLRYEWFRLSPRHKVMYTLVGKAACTSLGYAIWLANGGPELQEHDAAAVHQTGPFMPSLGNLPEDKIEEILLGGDWYRFTVVRDPLKRFIAAYVNKFFAKSQEGIEVFARQAARMAGQSWFLRPWDRPPLPIEPIVRLLLSVRPADVERHFRPQVDCILHSEVQYDLIAKLEESATTFPQILDRLQLKGPLARLDLHSSQRYAKYFEKEIKSAPYFSELLKFYEDDFEKLGYTYPAGEF